MNTTLTFKIKIISIFYRISWKMLNRRKIELYTQAYTYVCGERLEEQALQANVAIFAFRLLAQPAEHFVVLFLPYSVKFKSKQ